MSLITLMMWIVPSLICFIALIYGLFDRNWILSAVMAVLLIIWGIVALDNMGVKVNKTSSSTLRFTPSMSATKPVAPSMEMPQNDRLGDQRRNLSDTVDRITK